MTLSKLSFFFLVLLLSFSLISSAEITPVDEKYESKCEAGFGWIFCKAGEIWENWFKDKVIETSKENPLEEKPYVNNLGDAKLLLSGWQVTKQEGNENNFNVYIQETKQQDTSICFVLKEGVDISKVDLTEKPIETKAGAVTDKSVPLTLKYEPAKCLVDGKAVEGYKLDLADTKLTAVTDYIKIGTNSIILEYKNESKIQYDFDWGQTNITLLRNDTVEEDIFVYYNKSGDKYDFGANDYSPELKKYSYVLESNLELIDISGDYPLFYNYLEVEKWKEARQEYSFNGICNEDYSNCSYTQLTPNNIKIDFWSYGNISTRSIANVTGCATLSTLNQDYQLINNLTSTGSCITIANNGISLDGNGFYIIGDDASSTDTGVAISSTRNNITLKNLMFKDYAWAIRGGMSNSNITNITFNSCKTLGFALLTATSSGNIFDNLRIINPDGTLTFSIGYGNNNTFRNSNLTNGTFSTSSTGTNGGANNTLENITFFGGSLSTYFHARNNTYKNINITYGSIVVGYNNTLMKLENIIVNNSNTYCMTDGGIGTRGINLTATNCEWQGLWLAGSSNGYFENLNIYNSSRYESFSYTSYYSGIAGYQVNDTLIKNVVINYSRGHGIAFDYVFGYTSKNITFENVIIANTKNTSVLVGATVTNSNYSITLINATYPNETVIKTSGLKAELIRGWHDTVYVNDTLGSPFQGIPVWAVNGSSIVWDNDTTPVDGTVKLGLAQYINLNGVTTYQGNYTIFAGNSTYNATENMSTNRNTYFTLPADTTLPLVQFVSYTTPAGDVYASNLSFNVTASDNYLGLKNITVYHYNDTTLLNTSSTTSGQINGTYLNLKKGYHSFNVTAYDLSGNTNNTSIVYNLIDNVNPVVTIISPSAINYTSNVTSITYSAVDLNLDKCWYSLDNGTTNTTVTCASTISPLVANEMWNTWTVYANDTSGNIGSASRTFYQETLENITMCRTLSVTNLEYFLKNNLSASTSCLGAGTNNIIINGNGFVIDGDDSGSDTGISMISRTNVTVKNFASIKDFYIGVSLNSATLCKIENNTITSNTNTGISFINSATTNITNNVVTSNNPYGVYMQTTNRLNFTNLTISNTNQGIYTYYADNNSFNNLLVSTTNDCAVITYSNNNLFVNGNFTTSSSRAVYIQGQEGGGYCDGDLYYGSCYDIYEQTACEEQYDACYWEDEYCQQYDWEYPPYCDYFQSQETCEGYDQQYYCSWSSSPAIYSLNNTFVNISYSLNKETVYFGELIRKWYYQAQVKDIFNNSIIGAIVNVKNVSGVSQYSITTDSTGFSNIREITDYRNYGGTRDYSSMYNNTATSTAPPYVYNISSQLWNVTLQQNNVQVFILGLNVTIVKKDKYLYDSLRLPKLTDSTSKYGYNKDD